MVIRRAGAVVCEQDLPDAGPKFLNSLPVTPNSAQSPVSRRVQFRTNLFRIAYPT